MSSPVARSTNSYQLLLIATNMVLICYVLICHLWYHGLRINGWRSRLVPIGPLPWVFATLVGPWPWRHRDTWSSPWVELLSGNAWDDADDTHFTSIMTIICILDDNQVLILIIQRTIYDIYDNMLENCRFWSWQCVSKHCLYSCVEKRWSFLLIVSATININHRQSPSTDRNGIRKDGDQSSIIYELVSERPRTTTAANKLVIALFTRAVMVIHYYGW